MRPLAVLPHHGEPADPTLLEWVQQEIDSLLNAGPLTIVVVLGVLIVAFPAGLFGLVMLRRRRERAARDAKPDEVEPRRSTG